MLLNYTNDNDLIEQIKKENLFVANALSFEYKNIETILLYIGIHSGDLAKLNKLQEYLDISNYNVESLNSLQSSLANLQNIFHRSEFEFELSEYNKNFFSIFNRIFNFNTSKEVFLQNLLAEISENNLKKSVNNFDDLTDNNVLVISEKEQKVFLPYKKKSIENILLVSNKYSTYTDVLENLFIIPLNKYNNSSSARFREAFNLMHRKEFASFFKSLDFALEMFSRYDLHPAIISACQTIDELDIYLDCLDNNELQKFDIFEIKYEIAPSVVKQKNEF